MNLLNAQTLDPANRVKTALKLTKHSKETKNSKATAEGQDQSEREDNTVTETYDISAITAQGGTAEIKITAIKIESESDANQASYDSQNPDDGNPQMGSMVKDLMKNPVKITLDANGLIATVKGNEKMEAMQEAGSNSLKKGEMLDVFLKLDKPVNLNDTWKDASDVKGIKSTNNYTYKSFDNWIATIEQITALYIDKDIEQIGMKMHSKLEGKVVSILTVDAKTLIIKSKSVTTVMNGTVDAQGQTIPISTFSTATETVE